MAKFTQNVPRSKVVTVRNAMGVAQPDLTGATIPAAALVGDVAEQVMASDHPLPVVDAAGVVIGTLDRIAVTAVLLNKEASV